MPNLDDFCLKWCRVSGSYDLLSSVLKNSPMLRSITIDNVVGENEPDQKYWTSADCCISAALPDDIDRLEHLQFVRIQDAVRRIEKLLMIGIIESDLYLVEYGIKGVHVQLQ